MIIPAGYERKDFYHDYRVELTIPMWNELTALAAKKRVARSVIVREAIEKYLANDRYNAAIQEI